MPTITITNKLQKGGDLVAVPRNTYKEFLIWLKRTKSIKTFKPTKTELKALARGRQNLAKGKYLTLEELENELDSTR